MISIKWINVLGLLLDFSGAVILFFNSPFASKQIHFYEAIEAESINAKEHKKQKWLRIGFFFIASGFFAQIVAAII